VQFSVKDVQIDDVQRGFVMSDFESFARRYKETLEAGTLFVYIKTHGTRYKGDQSIHCRLQLRTRKCFFFSSSEGWGVEQTFRTALDRLEKQRIWIQPEIRWDLFATNSGRSYVIPMPKQIIEELKLKKGVRFRLRKTQKEGSC